MHFKELIEHIKINRPKIYGTVTLDLTNARSEYRLTLAGTYFKIIEATDLDTNIQIRFNDGEATQLTVKKREGYKIPFHQVFLSWSAQVGKSITIAYAVSEIQFEQIDQSAVFEIESIAHQQSSGATIYNKDCPAADTEYSQALPANTKKFTIKARGGALKVCFTATESGTKYITIEDGQAWSEDLLYLAATTLYFQSPVAGTDAEILAWT